MPLRGIVFDFDGVIANSEPLHFRAFRDVLADIGVVLTESDYYEKYLGFDDAGVFKAVADAGGDCRFERDDIRDLVRTKARRLEVIEHEGPVLFPGALEAITSAAALAPVAIASGARREEIERVIEREGLSRHFAVIVAAEDTARGKPAPDPYLRAVALLGSTSNRAVPAESCVAFEDSRWGLEAAATAGLHTVGVAQTYPISALAAADLVIESLVTLDWNVIARLVH